VTLDAWLVARLARELDEQLRHARIEAIHASAHDVIFFCYRRGGHIALHARLEQSAPLVCAYECKRPEKRSASHAWLGDVAALLRGSKFDRVGCIAGDRVLIADVSSRSAFGLPSQSRLIFELQPRKANAFVVRKAHEGEAWIVVAAHKQFAQGKVRHVSVGGPYEPPPPQTARLDRAQFIVAASEAERAGSSTMEHLLQAYDPECTPSLAREVTWRVAQDKVRAPAHAALRVWPTVRREVHAALRTTGNVFEWRDGARLFACHLIELHWPPYPRQSVPTLNQLCAQFVLADRGQPDTAADGVKKRLTTMLTRCKAELDRLERALKDAQHADELRRAGETIYAHLAEIAAGSDQFKDHEGAVIQLDPLLTAKENAAEFFRKYKKARSGVAAIAARLQTLRQNGEYFEHLLWELERGDLDTPQRDELRAQIASAIGVRQRQKKSSSRAARVERTVNLGDGAVALVGRSPKENERLTFSVAGPDDVWFHARGVPGAHVIVKANSAKLGEKQIRKAAALAAAHSRAAGATSAEVDYTQRRNVRRRGGGRLGLVWYTDFSTIRVKPEI
jgi:predicted ribosome quality control (RQC) complex YloA/Tae2 family protein